MFYAKNRWMPSCSKANYRNGLATVDFASLHPPHKDEVAGSYLSRSQLPKRNFKEVEKFAVLFLLNLASPIFEVVFPIGKGN